MHTLVLSDLHLGNGGSYDIFAGEAVLPRVLDQAAASRARVVLNGDSFDFLMNEDPLELTVERAVAQARALVGNPATAAALAALGRVLAAGGAVDVRLGNHDIELAVPEVQAVLRDSLSQPPAIAARLEFHHNDAPQLLEVGGARILLAHGEHNDAWNRIDYEHLRAGPEFRYPPGSRLVKTLLNPLKRRYGMRFADLVKPDFQGGVLTALAVDPTAVSLVFQGSTLSLTWQLYRRVGDDFTFGPGSGAEELGLADALDAAELTPEERAVLEALTDPDAPVAFGPGDGLLARARDKLARAGLRAYGALQRRLAGDSTGEYFSLSPSADEWTEAQRLAAKFAAGAVVLGHTHSARFRAEPGLTFVNTGTWIWLMRLPDPDADPDAWADFLAQCAANPGLDPAKGPAPQLFARFTGLVVAPAPQGGAELRLVEYTEAGEQVLGESHVAATGGAD